MKMFTWKTTKVGEPGGVATYHFKTGDIPVRAKTFAHASALQRAIDAECVEMCGRVQEKIVEKFKESVYGSLE